MARRNDPRLQEICKMVTGIEFMENKTLVRVRMEGSNPREQISRIQLEDKNKTIHYLVSLHPQALRLDQKDYTLEFPPLTPEITFITWQVDPIDLKPELEFQIDIPR